MASNTLLTPTMITRESLRILHQKLNFVGKVNRQFDDRFARDGAKIGDTLQIRLPNQYSVRTGKALNIQDTTEEKTDLTVGTQKGVDIEFDSQELTLDIDNFAERHLEPAMAVLAADIENDALSMYKDVYNQVDRSGNAARFQDLLGMRKQLTDSLAPYGNRCLNLNTQSTTDLVDALKGLFQDSDEIARQYKEGMLGITAGFGEVLENTLIPRETIGGQDGNYQTNGTSQTGSSIDIDTGTGTINKGNVFTIAGVNRVHPETKQDTGELQKFVATADFSGGAGTLSISPEIIASGPRQNVTNAAADNSSLTFDGTASTTHDLDLAFHRDAFAFVTAPLFMPQGVDFAARESMDGLNMRIIRDYDISGDTMPCRIDVLYGYKAIRPQLAARMVSN